MKVTLIIFAILFFTVIFVGSAKAQEADVSNKTDTKVEIQYDQNIKIKKRPQPMFSRSCGQSSGITRVLATFDKSGVITDVEIIKSSGCEGFDENAVRAAKKIKFTPAVKNGEAVTVKKQIEYTFSIGTRGI